jgi:protein TonB
MGKAPRLNEIAHIEAKDIKLVQPDSPEYDRDYYGSVGEDLDVEEGVEEPDEAVYSEGAILPFSGLAMAKAQRDKLFIAGLALALLLHVGVFALSHRTPSFMPPKSVLKPGETSHQVRLVELNQPKDKEEPPPDKAFAMSDRNHTAQRQRLPKRPTQPMSPPRMASLQAPKAPEVFDNDKPADNPVDKAGNKPDDRAVDKPKEEPPEQDPPPQREEEAPKPREQQRKEPLKGITALEKRPEPTEEPQPERNTAESRLDPLNQAMKKGLSLKPTWSELSRGVTASSRPSEYFEEGMVEEAVVDINTREERFYSYLLHLKRKIEGVWVYPKVAAKSGLGGKLTLEFLIAKDGELMGVNLLDSSGHTILDQYALRAIKSAAPYHPFPARLKAKRLRIRANFVYLTGRYFGRMM